MCINKCILNALARFRYRYDDLRNALNKCKSQRMTTVRLTVNNGRTNAKEPVSLRDDDSVRLAAVVIPAMRAEIAQDAIVLTTVKARWSFYCRSSLELGLTV
jgi:hypothetical protein